MTPLAALAPPSIAPGGLPVALAGAVVLGLTGSLHCFAMCGPLACSAVPSERTSRRRALLGYHSGRSLTYALEGGIVGAVGGRIAHAISLDLRPWAGWMVAALLIASALDLWKRFTPPAPLRAIASRVVPLGAKFSAGGRAAVLGVTTGLLPCGLLYGALGTALTAASFLGGAAVMLAFSLAGLPALMLAQLPFAAAFRAPRFGPWLKRGAPLLAAALVLVRAVSASGGRPACHSGMAMGSAAMGPSSDAPPPCPLHAHAAAR